MLMPDYMSKRGLKIVLALSLLMHIADHSFSFSALQTNLMLYSHFAWRGRKHNLMIYHLAFAVSCPIAMR